MKIRCSKITSYLYVHAEVRERIDDCSMFDERHTPGKWEYEKTAWFIEPRGEHGEIGFVKPGTERHKEILDD